MKIVLATTSPYRIEAFKFLGLDFTTEASNVEEKFPNRPENPEELVKLLSKMKAGAVAKNHSDAIVIGFDSVVLFDGKIYEKPLSKQEAFERIKSFSGKSFDFLTGIYMLNISNNKSLCRVVKTRVFLRELKDSEIESYLDRDSRFITIAMCFDPLEEYSTTFAKRVEGSYNNFIRGIPLEEVVEMLGELGGTQ